MSVNLISAADLAAHPGDEARVVIDCRFNLLEPEKGREMWRSGHIPGAFYAHLDEDLAGPVSATSGRHPLPDADEFARTVARWGVTPETQVVVYDDAGGAIAARLWWLLRWVGHERVQLLNGGLQSWTTESGVAGLETAEPALQDSPPYPVKPGSMPVIGLEEMRGAGRSIVALDARDAARYRGEVEPIDPVAGHIPGVENHPFQRNLDQAGLFLKPEQLRSVFAAVPGWEGAEARGSSCGSGVTACHNILAAEEAGFEAPALYVGSWSEWIRDPQRPIASGG